MQGMDYDIISAVLRFYENKYSIPLDKPLSEASFASYLPCVIGYEATHMPPTNQDELREHLIRLGYQHMEVSRMDSLAINFACSVEELATSLQLLNITAQQLPLP